MRIEHRKRHKYTTYNTTNPMKSMLKWLMATVVILASGCVDETFRIDEVSTEVTIAAGKTTLPLGSLDKMELGELMENVVVEGLEVDDNGNYLYRYAGVGEPQSFDNIQNTFTMPGTETRFKVDYPSLSLDMGGVVIDEVDDVKVNSNDILAMLPSTSGTLSANLAAQMPNIEGTYSKSFSGDDMHLLLDIPEQVEDIKKITFKDVEAGHHGAPMHLTVDLNGLAGINGGGEIDFEVALSGGKFRIVDDNGALLCDGNEYNITYDIEPGASHVDFVVYVESIENTAGLNSSHQLDIPLELMCNMSFSIKTKGGEYNLSSMPEFALYADFEYGDAEIIMNSDMALVEYQPAEPQKITINNLPAELKCVNAITLAEGTAINFYAHGLEWLGDNAEKVAVEVSMPDYLVLHAAEGAGYEYDEANSILKATIADISKGVALDIERLDFGAEGLSPNAEGAISLDLAFGINAHFVGEDSIIVSSLIHDDNIEIATGIDSIDLTVEALSGKVDYTYTLEQAFNIKTDGMNIGDLKVEGVGLSPIITLNLENPLTIPLAVEAELADDTGRKLELGNIVLNAATYENGKVVPAKNKIVIANKQPDYDCTYVAVNFDELIAGTIPSMLSVKLAVGVDSSEVQTLYVADKYEIVYDYAIELPVALNDKLKASYADEIVGLGLDLSAIAQYDVHVGDLTLVAQVENTTPLAFAADVTLLDSNGEELDLSIIFEEGYDRICGSEDGVTPAKSTLRLNIANGDGNGLDIANVVDLGGVRFSLEAMSDAQGDVAINKEQWVAATLMLEVADGITVDVKDFLK